MNGPDRRALLSALPNPAPGRDYLVTLDGLLASGEAVRLRYVPDREIVARDGFRRYLGLIGTLSWASLEALGAAVLDDASNAVVPRWLRVEVWDAAEGVAHRVRLEDRQPRWRNDGLIAGG